jgi:DNA polymerase V
LDIDVSIGISKSKVLSKLACEMAKPQIHGISSSHLTLPPLRGREEFQNEERVLEIREGGRSLEKGNGIYLIGQAKIPKILKSTKIQEIWGIGKKTTLALNRWGILNCDDLVQKSDDWLKTRIGKRGVELKHELLGECLDKVKIIKRLPKSIQNTRSFPQATNDIGYIKNALNIHIHNSCTRLRHFGGKCKTISVMLKTKDFVIYCDKKNLENLVNFEIEISRFAMKILKKLYNPNFVYRSCGVTLENLDFSEESQLSLFMDCKQKNFDKLGDAIDKLESKFGRNIVRTGFMESEV